MGCESVIRKKLMLFICIFFGVGLFVFSLPSSSTAASDPLYTLLYNGLKEYQTKISLGKYGADTVKVADTYERVLNDHPEIFYTKHQFIYNAQAFYPQYIGSKKQIEKMKIALNKKADAVVKIAKTKKTQAERVIYLHDYLVNSTEYDTENYLKDSVPESSFTAYGALIKGTAVCDGYAKALKILLNKAGIWAVRVTGEGKGVPHAWNLVKVDGKYFYVDATWNDPVAEDQSPILAYNYLLVPESLLAKDHTWNKKGLPKASSTKYKYLYTLEDFARYQSYVYYVNDKDAKLFRMNLNGSGKKQVSRTSSSAIYSLKAAGDTLYFINLTDNQHLYKMKLTGNNEWRVIKKSVSRLSIKGKYLYFYNNKTKKTEKTKI